MTKMILAFAMVFTSALAFAETTVGEKATEDVHDVKRSAKKTGHHLEESVCTKGDASCLADKAKHRAQEGVDYGKDKVSETKDKADKN